MLADVLTPSNELMAAIVAVAAAVNAVFTYLLHRSGTAASVANAQAIQAVHAVAVEPSFENKIAASRAVSNLPAAVDPRISKEETTGEKKVIESH